MSGQKKMQYYPEKNRRHRKTLTAEDLCNPSVTQVCMYLFLNVFLTQGCRELEVGPMLTDADAT